MAITDDQYRKLLSAVLDLKVAVSELALAVRSQPSCPHAVRGGETGDALPCADPSETNPACAEFNRLRTSKLDPS